MSNHEFNHLKKEQLKKRVKILNVVIYMAPIIAVFS
jgi:hypothetical protein